MPPHVRIQYHAAAAAAAAAWVFGQSYLTAVLIVRMPLRFRPCVAEFNTAQIVAIGTAISPQE